MLEIGRPNKRPPPPSKNRTDFPFLRHCIRGRMPHPGTRQTQRKRGRPWRARRLAALGGLLLSRMGSRIHMLARGPCVCGAVVLTPTREASTPANWLTEHRASSGLEVGLSPNLYAHPQHLVIASGTRPGQTALVELVLCIFTQNLGYAFPRKLTFSDSR